MSSFKLFSLANPEIWIIYCIIMLQFLPGQPSTCITKDTFYCKNIVRPFIECKFPDDVTIKYAKIERPNPLLHCVYNKGKYTNDRYVSNGYGYFGNVFWVTKSCRLKYKVCYSEITVSNGTSVRKQPLISWNVTRLSSPVVVNTDKTSLENTSDWYFRESHEKEAHELKSNKSLIVATAVTITLTVIGLVLYCWRKRSKRQQNSKELRRKNELSYGLLQKASNGKDNSYFILEPQKATQPIQHDGLELQGAESTQHNLKQGTNELTEETTDNCDVDSDDTYCSIDEVADAIQSLPDNEYNVLNTNFKYISHDPNYHSLSYDVAS